MPIRRSGNERQTKSEKRKASAGSESAARLDYLREAAPSLAKTVTQRILVEARQAMSSSRQPLPPKSGARELTLPLTGTPSSESGFESSISEDMRRWSRLLLAVRKAQLVNEAKLQVEYDAWIESKRQEAEWQATWEANNDGG